MGFIRGGLVTILAITLFVNLILINSLLTLTLSLNYNNVNQELTNATEKILQEELGIDQKINENFEKMNLSCQNNTDYVVNYEEYTFAIDCEVIRQGKEKTTEKIIENTVKTFYYQEYDCSFLECLQRSEYPFFLISERSRSYFQNKLYLAIIPAIIILVLIFILIEQKFNFPILVGGELILASLPFAKLSSILGSINLKFVKFFTIFFGSSYGVFLITFIIGLMLVSIGILLRILNWDSIKKKFSKEEVKEIIKEEISKAKENPTKEQKPNKKSESENSPKK